jgi:hypothetical protein
LLVDTAGFPLEVCCFEGNKAETLTLIPVLKAFQERHGLADLVVVADAGMLSAANLNALEDAGFGFIVGSRISKAPYDLAEHFARHGDHFADGQVLESARVMGTGKNARSRRVVYQYSFKRSKRDNKAINAMVERAEKVASGDRPVKKDRFVKLDGANKGVDWALVERARQLAGLKGYADVGVCRRRRGLPAGDRVRGCVEDGHGHDRDYYFNNGLACPDPTAPGVTLYPACGHGRITVSLTARRVSPVVTETSSGDLGTRPPADKSAARAAAPLLSGAGGEAL